MGFRKQSTCRGGGGRGGARKGSVKGRCGGGRSVKGRCGGGRSVKGRCGGGRSMKESVRKRVSVQNKPVSAKGGRRYGGTKKGLVRGRRMGRMTRNVQKTTRRKKVLYNRVSAGYRGKGVLSNRDGGVKAY